MVKASAFAALLLVGSLAAVQAQADGIEYALRWNAGGPSTAKETVRLLQLKGSQVRTVYQVEYFDLGEPPLPGPSPIARRRTSDRVEITLKYRDGALPAEFDAVRACPLGKKVKVKRETDIAFDALLRRAPVASVSCEREGGASLVFPSELRPKSRGCTTTMVRIAVAGFKIEEWMLSARPVVELSLAAGGDADLARFEKIARRLPLNSLTIEKRSKSELGSNCR